LGDAGPFALALKFHPDVNKKAGAENKFKEIATAYEAGAYYTRSLFGSK
jgi:hypothetical protein